MRFKQYIENILAAIGLLALIGGCAWLVLSLERAALPQCDISIKTSNGTSCYLVKEYRK